MGYKLPSTIDDTLQGLATQYGNTCRKFYLDYRTWDLLQVPAVLIQSGTDPRIPVLLTGGLHPREMAPPDALLSFCTNLLDADDTGVDIPYGEFTDATGAHFAPWAFPADTARNILQRFSLIVVPCANPDGRNYVMTSDDEDHDLWRLNRRPPNPDCWGVNINRNFPFVWDKDKYYTVAAAAKVYSSKDPCSEQFRGYLDPEPETQNLVDLVAQQRIAYLVDVHSFGRKVFYPWGMERDQTTVPLQNFQNADWDGQRDGPNGTAYGEYMPPQLSTKLIQLSGAMVDEIKNSAGPDAAAIKRSTYTAMQSGPSAPTTGAFDDYTFGQQFLFPHLNQICSFTLECGYERPDLDDDDGGYAPDYDTQYPKVEREVHAALIGLLNAI